MAIINHSNTDKAFLDMEYISEPECNDVVFDFEMEAGNANGEEWVPSLREYCEFIWDEVTALVSEYTTPFNILAAKVVIAFLAVVILSSSISGDLIEAHNAKKQDRQSVLATEQSAAREVKRLAVIAGKKDVLGKWYEMDPERDDIRTLFIEVDDEAKCVYTIGDETGEFTYREGKLSLMGAGGELNRTLVLKDNQLDDEASGISYYKTDANISSLKFAEFLKDNLPGTYQEFLGGYLLIFPNGKWQVESPWGFDESGTWTMEINEGSVLFIFEGMGVHYGGGNIYKVNEEEYDAERATISSGDFSLTLDVNIYNRISRKLP